MGKFTGKPIQFDGQEPWFPVPIFPAKPLENTMGTYPEVADLRLEDGTLLWHSAPARRRGVGRCLFWAEETAAETDWKQLSYFFTTIKDM